MKFKDVNEFKTYLEDKLSSKKVLKQHLNVFEDSREMTDIKKDKTNLTWDWMENNTIYLVRSNSSGRLTYLYAPKSREKKSYEESGFVIDDSYGKMRNIFYAQKNVWRLKEIIKNSSPTLKFDNYQVGDWDAPIIDAKWVQAIFKVDLKAEKLLMNWNNIPWEDLK